MEEIKVFIVNLGKYNEGTPTGAWFTLPIDSSELKERLELGGNYEEYAIHDYESPIPISEYTSIAELNKLFRSYQTIAENADPAILHEVRAIVGTWFTGLDDLAEHVDDIMVYHVGSMKELAMDAVDSGAVFGEVPSTLSAYIDYEALGRDLNIDGNYLETTEGVFEYNA